MQQLILASGSARRRDFLERLGVAFEVYVADVDETPCAGEAPEAMALRLARAKADAVAAHLPERWVLAADTVVAIDAEILGKPRDRGDARRMLRALGGRGHRVVTGVVLLAPGGDPALERAEVTGVHFRPLAEAEIDAYVAGGEADDKAGAYAIQGGAAGFVTRVDGSHSNVVGLPLEVVAPALQRAGFALRADVR